MGKNTFIGFLVLISLTACLDQSKEDMLRKTPKGGWVTYWDFANGASTVETASEVFNDIFLFVAHLDENNNVVMHKSVDVSQLRSFIDMLNASGTRSWLTVVNDVIDSDGKVVLKDSTAVEEILSTSDSRQAHIGQLIKMADDFGFRGVDVDYENLQAHVRDNFSVFAREFFMASSEAGLQLSFTVQPKDREKSSTGAGTMDWRTLCESADRVQIMLYNEHSGRTAPGPMATPNWISRILDYAISQCSREKIVPILKVSGMDWGAEGAKGIQYMDVANLIQQYRTGLQVDPRGNTPYFTYNESDVKHTVYFENATSLMTKLDGILNYNLGGVVFWSLGKQDPLLIEKLSDQPPISKPAN